MNMTKQDIIEYFTKNEHAETEYSTPAESAMYDDWAQPEDWDNVTSESVDHYGGEDCGSTYYTVYKFVIDNAMTGETFYLRFDGWYASHYGTDYQDFREVQPRPTQKIEYY
jgi:hypothetical protein